MGTQSRTRPTRHRRWRSVAAIGCTVASVAALLVAWQQPGFPEVPPQRVDTSIWVINDARSLVGRINTEIGELDSAAPVRGIADILQDPSGPSDGGVLVVDRAKHELQVLDTATVTFGARVSIPDDEAADLRAGTLAVVDRMDGRLWVGDSATVASVDSRLNEPTATLGALPVLTISTQGTVFATAVGSAELISTKPGADPVRTAFAQGELSLVGTAGSGGAAAADDLQITAVGEQPVVLDRADSSLRVDGRRIVLPTLPGAVLQQPGPDAAEVMIAYSQGLVAVALADGAVRTVTDISGLATAPVVSGSCVYGAWLPGAGSAPGPARAIAACGDGNGSAGSSQGDAAESTESQTTEPAGSLDAVELTFRQRGTAVVLTDSASGLSWVASDAYRKVDNWDDVGPPETRTDDAATLADPTRREDLPRLPPDCTAVTIGVPVAVDDEFGVRAGRASVLRVLDNDPSVDCTSVVIDSVTALPAAAGSVAIVGGGSAIQLTLPATATGTLPPIEYTVGNGRGGTATARVLVAVVPAEISRAPEMVRTSAVTTEVNGTVSYNILDDYLSPTGDDLYLAAATGSSTDVLSFRPDGTITYRSTGAGVGTDASVDVVISDGVEQTAGRLTVAIAPADSTTPVVYPSFATAVLGSEAVANPLRRVVSAATQPVTISTVRPEPGSESATARLDPLTGSVAVTATTPGSYYFTFEAATGGRGVTGVLRADFVEPSDTASAVVPMADVAYLTPGGQTVLDPLANDTDPDGQGLAVREVDLPAGSPVTAAVVDLHLVQVSAPRALRGAVVFGYSVFDGTGTQVGQIRIVPVPAPKRIPSPLAAPITATVRAGDAVTIPLSRFATSQDGSPVTAELDPAQVAALPGRAFSTGDTIRYFAPADSPTGPVAFSYTAVAGSSTPLQPVQTVSTVTITVTSADPSRNSAPNTPVAVTARVFTEGAISISVPLAGTDPDGDWVVLQSLEQPDAPLGDVAVSGSDTLSYKATQTSGVDRIRYLATDPAGLTVTGTVTVLVVEPGDSARPPVAPDLAVAVRPGASIRIDPVAVAVDPGGQRVRLASPGFVAPPELRVEVDDQSLILTAPPTPTVASLRYTVVNAKGLTASGSVRVTVSSDAPVPAPTAADVFVRPADLAANKQTVDVDVSSSVVNRSGRRDDLTVSVDPLSTAQATTVAPRLIRISVTDARQIVAYRVTDAYGESASAFIVVPPQQQLAGAQLISGKGPIQLDAGKSVDVEIGDYVTIGGGGSPTIAATPALQATQGTAVRNSATSLTLSAPSSAGGAAALYVPIEDGADSVVVLALAVQIEPRLVPPPKLDSTGLQIEAGTSASVDLKPLTGTADSQQRESIVYAVGPGQDGIVATLSGAVVTVTVRPDVPRGTELALPIQAVDGEGRDGKAVLTVTVTGSRQPLATVIDQQITEGRAGVEVAADMLTGSFDPIGLGLTIIKVSVPEGIGGIAAGPVVAGSTVRLTPAAGFVGNIVVAAEIIDGTKDPERVVTSNLRVSIQDKPSAPGAPALVQGTLGPRSVQLAWAPSDANGAAVQTYTVAGGGVNQECSGSESSCVVEGLTAGQPYVFVVTARNSVGTSAPSAPSAVIVPDATPSVPAPPTVQYVDRGRLTVSWAVPTGEFTPVTGTSIQVLRNGSVVEVQDNVRSPLTFNGLDQGSGYQFQVRAGNQQGTSDWSAPSTANVPSGVPSAPTGLQANFVFDKDRRGIDVRWGPPADTGGEPVLGYRLLVNNVEIASGGGDFQSKFVDYPSNSSVDVTVIARNGRGEGPASGPARVDFFNRPDKVTGLTVTTPDVATLAATWSPVGGVDRYEYRVNAGPWSNAGGNTSATIGGLEVGKPAGIDVRACNGKADYSEDVRCGPASDVVPGAPFGDLTAPVAKAALTTDGRQVSVTWSIPESGNGRTISESSVSITGSDSANPDPSGTTWTSKTLGLDQSVSVTVRYCVSTGPNPCRDATAKATTASSVALPTVAVGALAGICGTGQQTGGDWPIDPAACGSGVWIPVTGTVAVKCQAVGIDYLTAPLATTTDNRWYRSTDNDWYRFLGFASTDVQIPRCP